MFHTSPPYSKIMKTHTRETYVFSLKKLTFFGVFSTPVTLPTSIDSSSFIPLYHLSGPCADGRPYVVAVALDNGSILFLRRFDDPAPLQLDTGLQAPLYMEWSNAGELLAVAGWEAGETCLKAGQPPRYKNTLKFYTDAGVLLYVINIPSSKVSTQHSAMYNKITDKKFESSDKLSKIWSTKIFLKKLYVILEWLCCPRC